MAGAGFFVQGIGQGLQMFQSYQMNQLNMKLTAGKYDLMQKEYKLKEREVFIKEKLAKAKELGSKSDAIKLENDLLDLKKAKEIDRYGKYFHSLSPQLRTFVTEYDKKYGIGLQTGIDIGAFGEQKSPTVTIPDPQGGIGINVTEENLPNAWAEYIGGVKPTDIGDTEEEKSGWTKFANKVGGLLRGGEQQSSANIKESPVDQDKLKQEFKAFLLKKGAKANTEELKNEFLKLKGL